MEDNQKDLKKMETMKKNYEQVEMPQEAVLQMQQKMGDAKMKKKQLRRTHIMKHIAAAAAAVAVFIALPNASEQMAYAMGRIPVLGSLVKVVTFRDYRFESERQNASVDVPELMAEELTEGGAAVGVAEETLKKTTEEINAEIQEITDGIIAEFEENLQYEEGYQDIIVEHEVLATTADYFTLKLICYQGAGSGAEWDYYYTIDLAGGERMKLADLFTEGADYITPISENIKTQMAEQMAADEKVYYWLENEDVPEWNFQAITEETSFYVNADNEVVIGFDEGEVAPMYMGSVEFTIPAEVLASIRK